MSDVESIYHAIATLKARSLLAVDEKRWPDFAACFTPDARIDYSRAVVPGSDGPLEVPSIEAYVALASGFVGDAKTMHVGSLPIIEIVEPDRAKATWKMEDVIVRAAGSALPSRHGYFVYEDEYRLTDAGWRISSLTFVPWFEVPLDHQ